MRRNTIFALNLIFCFVARSQDNFDSSLVVNKLSLPEISSEKCIVFSKDYPVSFYLTSIDKRYTPTFDDILLAEKLFSKYKSSCESLVNKPSGYFKWMRQYLGFIDKAGRKNIVVQVINCENPGRVRKLLGKKWEEHFVVLFSDEFYKLREIYRINLVSEDVSTSL